MSTAEFKFRKSAPLSRPDPRITAWQIIQNPTQIRSYLRAARRTRASHCKMRAHQVLAVGFALVAAASAQQCGKRNTYSALMDALQPEDSNYIVGGTLARKNEFPWQVSIQVSLDPESSFDLPTTDRSRLDSSQQFCAEHAIPSSRPRFRAAGGKRRSNTFAAVPSSTTDGSLLLLTASLTMWPGVTTLSSLEPSTP